MTFALGFLLTGKASLWSSARQQQYFKMDLRSRRTTRLTNTAAIDTSPSFSDGRRIVFGLIEVGVSNSVMNGNGGGAQRISFDLVAIQPLFGRQGRFDRVYKQHQGRFMIGVMRPDGKGERILTEGYHNEGPLGAQWTRVGVFQGYTGCKWWA